MQRLSRLEGTGGYMKGSPDDFIVEEIAPSGTVLEIGRRYSADELGMAASADGRFSTFVLQKRGWNTIQALRAVAKKLGRGFRSAGFAGTKDRTAVSTQLCSVFGAGPEALLAMHIKDIAINGAWRSDEPVRIGYLAGNRFTITVRDAMKPGAAKAVDEELCGVFPNYFGEQRFGARKNNFEIGLAMLKGDLEDATMRFLTDTGNETNADAVAARGRLRDEMDFDAALGYFPKHLKYERLVLDRLALIPNDYCGALRRLPRQLLLMFVHSVESQLFNDELELRVKGRELGPLPADRVCGANALGFPDMSKIVTAQTAQQGMRFIVGNMIGYGTERINETESGMLDELGLSTESFRMKAMPELNMKGAVRVLFAPYTNLSLKPGVDDTLGFSFSLPPGSYASVLMEEFVGNGVRGPTKTL